MLTSRIPDAAAAAFVFDVAVLRNTTAAVHVKILEIS